MMMYMSTVYLLCVAYVNTAWTRIDIRQLQFMTTSRYCYGASGTASHGPHRRPTLLLCYYFMTCVNSIIMINE